MTNESTSYTGACYCGAIRFRVTAEFSSVCICHCRSCQSAAGAPFVAWATTSSKAFVLLAGDPGEITRSSGATRGFCAECGSSLTYRHENRPGDIDICLATLEDAAGVVPEYHIWVADKMPWIRLDDGLPQYDEWRSASA